MGVKNTKGKKKETVGAKTFGKEFNVEGKNWNG